MAVPELKELIFGLASLMSVTGFTGRSSEKLTSLIGDYFDEVRTDPLKNHLFIKRCGRENAPKILIDTHFDEIGMMVTDIKDGGFVTVDQVGGVDTRILQASEVIIYGQDAEGKPVDIYGVVGSTPPHLQKPGDASKLKSIDQLLIDTGYTKEELSKYVKPGTPVGFKPIYAELRNRMIAGKAFDDKACGACAVAAIASVPAEELIGDVYFLFSNFEEDGAFFGGARTGAWSVDPDVALVADVNLAHTPDTKKSDTVEVNGGVSVTISPITDGPLTKLLSKLCTDNGVKNQPSVATRSTGTNTNVVNCTGSGIPTVDIGLPLRSMHTSGEVISLEDAEAMRDCIKLFITSEEIAKELEW